MKQLPDYFTKNLKDIYSSDELKTIKKAFSTEKRNSSFLLNSLIPQSEEVLETLEREWIGFEEISGLSEAYILKNSEDNEKLWKLDIIKRWLIYLQGLSSQLPIHFFNLSERTRVLDLSAAPWWKTSQIARVLNNTWEIIALDKNAIRIDKLKFTLDRQQVKNTKIIKSDARNYHSIHEWELFDAIIFDAPCSAEWRINLSNEKSYNFLSEWNNKKMYKLQKDILKNNIQLLKEGWELIYSTCTLSPLENEAVVHFLLCNFPELEISELDTEFLSDFEYKNWITHFWDIAYKKEVSHSVRILPSEKTEWFFIAKFRKKL